ncbi:Tryptophan-specific transport protein [invertebrate metagenome]|uniref:Tryptophan-specific transport protein n=1 Tax=invertebrate metagenome TaxID=1711999 RepID=A0A2H9TCL4_9ZZZZ
MSEVFSVAEGTQKLPRSSGTALGGAFISAGTAVGAGMFSMPVVTSGLWFGYSLLLLLVVAFCMYSASLYVLEVNLRFPERAGFDSMTEKLLGRGGRIINGIAIGFVCYVLTYAYISGGSSIVSHTAVSIGIHGLSPVVGSLVFAVILSVIVVVGTKAVDRVSTVLIGGMVVTFVGFSSGLAEKASTTILFPSLDFPEIWSYSLVSIPFIAVSFGSQTCIPSLTRYLNRDAQTIRRAVLWGVLLTLAFYILWEVGIFSNLARDQFPAIVREGGNIGALLSALDRTGISTSLSYLLKLFANMAVASSFLGVGLSLFDYIVDLFGFTDGWSGHLKAGLLTFIPPTVLGVLFPNGFIAAIAFAGFGVVILCILSPVLMAWISRCKSQDGLYRVPGGNARMILVALFGVAVAVLSALDMLSVLPHFIG